MCSERLKYGGGSEREFFTYGGTQGAQVAIPGPNDLTTIVPNIHANHEKSAASQHGAKQKGDVRVDRSEGRAGWGTRVLKQ